MFLKIRRQEVHWKPKVWKPNVTQKISLTANPSDWFSWKQINLDNNGIRSHRFHSAESRACVPLTSQADILDAVQLIHYAFEFCLQSSFQSRLIPKKICLLLLRHQKNQVSNYFNQQKQTKKNCNCTARTCGMQSEATFQATHFLCRSCRLYLHLINSYEKWAGSLILIWGKSLSFILTTCLSGYLKIRGYAQLAGLCWTCAFISCGSSQK